MKTIVLSCMHGRHETVKKCLDKMKGVEIYMGYSTDRDGYFLEDTEVTRKIQVENSPLSYKWQTALNSIKDVEFDNVVLMGSDDYFCENFIPFVNDNMEGVDMMGFIDLYFNNYTNMFYWSGYPDERRKGEPSGAGKVYSKRYLESIGFELFEGAIDRGLDYVSWCKVQETAKNIKIVSLKENGLFLCDIKDKDSMTSTERIEGIEYIGTEEDFKP